MSISQLDSIPYPGITKLNLCQVSWKGQKAFFPKVSKELSSHSCSLWPYVTVMFAVENGIFSPVLIHLSRWVWPIWFCYSETRQDILAWRSSCKVVNDIYLGFSPYKICQWLNWNHITKWFHNLSLKYLISQILSHFLNRWIFQNLAYHYLCSL